MPQVFAEELADGDEALVHKILPVVRIAELPWHDPGWAGALLIALLNAWWERRKALTTPRDQFEA